MDPQNNQAPGFGLPQPAFSADGQQPPQLTPAISSSGAAVQGGVVATAPQQPYAPPVTSATSPVSEPALATLGITDSVQENPAAHADSDSALDEEWVNKAREIVQKTHADPYLQSKELGKIKAQYIKVRYNKDIKDSEE